ncbi:uncharacterized protein LOC141594065 [Silene latifolia]|uniref:uncharacterized protein LOC141594065 n=1 Tax=Silene latifolia TaxID=37657 RepID=UPI003D778706
MDKNKDETKIIGQGELYSPNHAIKINTNHNINHNNYNNKNNNLGGEDNKENKMVVKGVASDIRSRMITLKDKVMEKLTAAAVPSDKLENARSFLETMIKDVTSAAQGITKDALQRIKSHLVDILPSISPSLTSKMVDDADEEAESIENDKRDNKEMKKDNFDEHHHKGKTVSRL